MSDRFRRWPAAAASWLFSVYAALVTLVCNAATWPFLLLVPGADRRRAIARFGTSMVFRLTGIGLAVEGRENLPAGPCVVVANHRSYFDGLALICGLPPGFSPMIKDAVRRIPALGTIMARAGSLYVRRSPAAAAGVDTLRVIRRVRAGVSPAIFAEGTLSPDRGLLPLRDGAFLIAARTGLPVVPVALEGSDSVLPPGGRRFRRGHVRVRIGRPVAPTGRDRAAWTALRDDVEQALWSLLSPATAGWRSAMSPPAYYARALAAYAAPLSILDLDTLAARQRAALGRLPSKPLRVDARALSDPALALRLWRGDVRINGVVFERVDTATAWIRDWAFAGALLAPPAVDEALAGPLAGLAKTAPDLTIAVALDDPRQLEHLAAARTPDAAPIRIRARIDVDAALAPAATVANLRAVIARCQAELRLCFDGALLDSHYPPAGASSEAVAALVERVAGLAGPVAVSAAAAPLAVLRSRAVAEIVVGHDIERAASGESGCHVLAGTARACDGGYRVTPTDCAALGWPRARRVDLYGGAVVAERGPSDGPTAAGAPHGRRSGPCADCR